MVDGLCCGFVHTDTAQVERRGRPDGERSLLHSDIDI